MRAFTKSFQIIFISLLCSLLFSMSDIANPISYSDMIYVRSGVFMQYDSNPVNGKVYRAFLHDISSVYIGKYEVTYQLWSHVYDWAVIEGYTFDNSGQPGMGTLMTKDSGVSGLFPVTNINYYDALVWCNAYSEKYKLTPVYYTKDKNIVRDMRNLNQKERYAITADWSANGYRLPTEGEWKFAARSRGSDERIKVKQKMTDRLYHVNRMSANKIGIHGVDGNVWEWCWDWYGSLPNSTQSDYRGPRSGNGKITLGGQAYLCDHIISGHRLGVVTGSHNDYIGMRVARNADK
ncbi:MAG: SUMF1/EgtB/PvdO family nonheme iron enzyme [Spirochaetes bacterium]|jgi:sulfatase modifying factor 1|nr:SUMF1/EgtB/PvdO family nonheme iron enzyme [Spirochaetota bacterium]